MKFVPYPYQQYCIDSIIYNRAVGLFLDMGLSKTVITLTAIHDLRYNRWEVSKPLIIAPKKVAEATWTTEAKKWEHLKMMRVVPVLGTAQQRIRALATPADVYVVNRENVQWLVEHFKNAWPFDMVVLDESSSFKNSQSKRFKSLKLVRSRIKRIVELTGTPSSNGLEDLWAQIYLLDGGARLGKTLGAYRDKYFVPGRRNRTTIFNYSPKDGSFEMIKQAISDICISMSAADYLKLPRRIDNRIPVKLSPQEMKQYKTMEAEQLLHIDDEDVVALNAAAVMTKLLQIANGSVYSHEGNVVRLHDAKLEALLEIIDTTDSPVLVFYSYKHDLDAIRAAIPEARTLDGPEDIAEWNAGEVQVLLAHPASVGYGLNLQEGGHVIVWYGLTWSLELYQQANARLYRQGQEKPVIIHHLIAEGTVDEQVMDALEAKDTSQAALMAALKERRNK